MAMMKISASFLPWDGCSCSWVPGDILAEEFGVLQGHEQPTFLHPIQQLY